MESFQILVIRHLLNIENLIKSQGVSMALDFTKLESSVAAETAAAQANATSTQHAIDLLNQISAELKVISGLDPVAIQAEVDKLQAQVDAGVASITASSTSLDAAVVADTPAPPAPPTPAPTPAP